MINNLCINGTIFTEAHQQNESVTFQLQTPKGERFWCEYPLTKGMITLNRGEQINIHGTLVYGISKKERWHNGTKIRIISISKVNTIVLDGIVGSTPKETNKMNEEEYSFLLYNNRSKEERINGGTGFLCYPTPNARRIAKTLVKGQDVLIQGKLETGIQAGDERVEYNCTVIRVHAIKYGQIQKSNPITPLFAVY
jgi:hypothetical protein